MMEDNGEDDVGEEGRDKREMERSEVMTGETKEEVERGGNGGHGER